ncbi:MAG TPA: MIP/aquaporin family protein [Gemmatimonadota bacterium]|nr:MIP/aquaporin family protein [Gemmatimonadota bacterium]
MSERLVQTVARRAMAEGVGTFFFILMGTASVVVDVRTGGALGPVGIALAWGFALTGMIYTIGHLSGAHVNPAVTIALWAVRRFPARDTLYYIPAQCLGATAASLVLWALLGDLGDLGATRPALDTGGAFAVEWLLSFALMFVIAAAASDERVAYGFGGLAVGLALSFDHLVGLTLTGSSMNPARSLGPAIVAGVWDAHWLYWLAPILGMIAAAWTYETLRTARTPDLQTRRARLFGVSGEIGRAPRAERRRGRGRRAGVDRRSRDMGPPEGVSDRRTGLDRRENQIEGEPWDKPGLGSRGT